MTDIFEATRSNDKDAVLSFIRGGNDVNERQEANGLTPLHICATFGCVDTAVLLLNHGANHGAKDWENSWTPLHRSIYFRHLEITLLLIKHGSFLDQTLSLTSASALPVQYLGV